MCPPRLPPGDRRHLLPGHLLHGCTVAGAGVPRCARTGTGGRCGRAALCAHGRAMPVTRLRVLRQMPHPVPEVSGPRSHRRRLQTESTRQLEVCPTELLAKQDSSVQRNTHQARETNAHHVLSGQGSTQGRQKSWQPGDRTNCVRCNRTIFNHVATQGA